VKELAAAAAAQGYEFLDAPVTGSKSHAAAGELNFLVGGSAAIVERVQPALAVMSRTVTHLGPTGSGALVKLINNFMTGAQVAAFAEAMGMIERSGLDRSKALLVVTEGASGSPLVKTVAARMTASDFTPQFQLGLLVKDLKYVLKEGALLGLPLATATTALEVFERSVAAGLGDRDMSAVVEQFRRS
jgi:3-hydroxyisobutyrate dehydrogenase